MTVVTVPGSKSYTQRALLLAALAKGESVIKNVLLSDDTKYMLKALRQLGVKWKMRENTVFIEGCHGIFKKPASPLFLGNAGTAMRFLAAALATQPFESVLDGNSRMRERPIGDLLKGLRQLGVEAVSLRGKDYPPIRIRGPLLTGPASAGKVRLRGDVSSQFLSGLLMACPLAKRSVSLEVQGKLVSKPYVEMTLEVMKHFGVSVGGNGLKRFSTTPQTYRGKPYAIEADASSAIYFWGLAALIGREIGIKNISKKSKQADLHFLNMAEAMSGKIHESKSALFLKGPRILQPLGEKFLSDLPDASLAIAVLCSFADGVSKLRGLANLRVKESDRISALAKELRKIGVKIRELRDGWEIHGNPLLLFNQRQTALIETYDDHRIAMCFGMLRPFFPKLHIKNPQCVSKSYPNFWKDLKKLQITNCKRQTNIVLTGMRGSGKTTLGRRLAQKLQRRFIDLDTLIEKYAKQSIPEIVALKGWKYFRRLERKTVRRIANMTNAVIAAGGGTILNPKNVKLLKKNGLIFFLKVPLGVLKRRLMRDYKRPSLTGQNFLKELPLVWRKRKKIYESAADKILSLPFQDIV